MTWAHAIGFDPSTELAGGGVQIDDVFAKDGGRAWSGPFTLSAGCMMVYGLRHAGWAGR